MPRLKLADDSGTPSADLTVMPGDRPVLTLSGKDEKGFVVVSTYPFGPSLVLGRKAENAIAL